MIKYITIKHHIPDFFIEQKIYLNSHHDAITHIPGYLTQKDIVITIVLENDADKYIHTILISVCIEDQHTLEKDQKDKGLNVYSNALRETYDIFNMKYLNKQSG